MSTSTSSRRRRAAAGVATVAALGLTLAACGGSSGETEGTGEGAGDQTITLGYIPSWTDGLSTAYLLENQLEGAGYDVEHVEISDAGVLYTALAQGDIDIYPSAWPELTHATYMEQYGDQIEDLGTYYDSAQLTFAVPEYTDIDSIADLPDHVEDLGGRIVGIEPGAGLTETTLNSVIPTYGLDQAGFTLAESSTQAMLTELDQAIQAQEDIVVTLWRPFWPNAAFPVKDLADPEGALGGSEGLHFLGTTGVSEEFPEVTEWISGITLDDDQYGTLEQMVAVDGADDPAAGVEAWLAENPDVITPLPAS